MSLHRRRHKFLAESGELSRSAVLRAHSPPSFVTRAARARVNQLTCTEQPISERLVYQYDESEDNVHFVTPGPSSGIDFRT